VALEWRYGFEEATPPRRQDFRFRPAASRGGRGGGIGTIIYAPAGIFPGTARRALPAAEIGSAHHAFLERVDLAQTGSAARLRAEAARLRRDGCLTRSAGGLFGFQGPGRFLAIRRGKATAVSARKRPRQRWPSPPVFSPRNWKSCSAEKRRPPSPPRPPRPPITLSTAPLTNFVIVQA